MSIPRVLELERTTLAEQLEIAPVQLGAVARAPTRRDYWSGNSLFLHDTPTDLDAALTVWREHLPTDDLAKCVLQWEAPTDLQLAPEVAARAEDLGLALDRSDLMELGELREPRRRTDIAPKVAHSDTDWACVAVLLTWINPEGSPDFWRWMGATGFRTAAQEGHCTAWLVHRHAEPACLVVVGRGGGVGYVSAVVTHPSHRGRGLATALTHHACQVHRFRHPDDTILLGADPGEAPQRIYQDLGFTTVSGWWELTGEAAPVRAALAASDAEPPG